MPVIRPTEAARHEAHGAAFHSFVAPSRGSTELCAWRLEVAAGVAGVPHRPTREEVLLVLDGELRITLDGVTTLVGPGDVVHVPAGTSLTVDGGDAPAAVWVATSRGLEAELADGSRLSPPWTR